MGEDRLCKTKANVFECLTLCFIDLIGLSGEGTEFVESQTISQRWRKMGYENHVPCMFAGKDFAFNDSLTDPYNTKAYSIAQSCRWAEIAMAAPTFNLSRCGGRLDRLIALRYSEA